jgi:exosome complex exonuclease RRP6
MNDGIVVVGQHQKKRKRDRAAKQAEDAAPTPSASTPEVEVEAFDYASAPNILDEGAELLEDGSGKKRKLGKREGRGGLFQYGDFPAPPRNPTEIRSGNRSYTYR